MNIWGQHSAVILKEKMTLQADLRNFKARNHSRTIQQKPDHIPLETINYLRFLDDPMTDKFVKNFRGFKDEFRHTLDGPSYLREYIRETSSV